MPARISSRVATWMSCALIVLLQSASSKPPRPVEPGSEPESGSRAWAALHYQLAPLLCHALPLHFQPMDHAVT